MRKIAVLGLLGAFAAFAWFSLPKPGADPDGPEGREAAQGVVLAVDGPARSLTISHGALRSAGMGPMTMVFRVRDSDAFERVKAGDRITFVVEGLGGELVATNIRIVQ